MTTKPWFASSPPEDFETAEQIAEVAAPIFALHGWTWSGEAPDASRIAARILDLYERFAEDPEIGLSSTGRFVLTDENPHDGTPVLHEGIRVLLDLGELPPLRGDFRERVEHREGMVTVYDSDGEYVGCMGVETWRDLLAAEKANSHPSPQP